MGPLYGLRVLDVSTVLAGPLTCQLLGDYGAEVIKIEHPRGDSMRGHGRDKDGDPAVVEDGLGRNKRCIGLDLGDPDGAEVFRRLVGDGRRRGGELPAGHAGALGARLRGAAEDQPAAGAGPDLGLRPDRPLSRARGLRHPGRGDERLRRDHRRARRSADAAAVRARRRHRGHHGRRAPR